MEFNYSSVLKEEKLQEEYEEYILEEIELCAGEGGKAYVDSIR